MADLSMKSSSPPVKKKVWNKSTPITSWALPTLPVR
jgi:hypothetical protein